MIEKLDKYILNSISEYLYPYEKFNFLLTSKNINNEMKEFNHILQLNINHNNKFDLENFLNLYYSHKKLKVFNIYRLCNPQVWLYVEWVNCVYMHYCKFSSIIKPPLSLKTEKLHIYNSKESKLIIDWMKFPNLKSLYLDCYDIDLKGIEKCKNLETIFIQVKNELIKDLNNIGSLKKLRYFISNFKVQNITTFYSQYLTQCLVEKNDIYNNIIFNCDNVNTKKYFYSIELDFANLYQDIF
jgi:hypothetical protein